MYYLPVFINTVTGERETSCLVFRSKKKAVEHVERFCSEVPNHRAEIYKSDDHMTPVYKTA